MKKFSNSPLGQAFNNAAFFGLPILFGAVASHVVSGTSIQSLAAMSLVAGAVAVTAGRQAYRDEKTNQELKSTSKLSMGG